MSLFSRTDRSFLGRWWWTVDRGLLAAFLFLILCGVILVATASPPVAERVGLNPYHFVLRHLMFMLPALAGMIVTSFLDARTVWRVASMVFALAILGMVLVLFFGTEIKGARRWIPLLGFSVQPSEFAKPAFAIVAAWFIALRKTRPGFPGHALAAGVFGLLVCLLLLQPDLGMTFVVTGMGLALLFLAGFPFRLVFGLSGLGALGFTAAYFTFEHFSSRIQRFMNPSAGDNYQVQKSLEAFHSGGVFGTGPGQGEVKMSLPDAHADFIFSVAAEEMGVLLALALIGIFAFVVVRGFGRMMESDELFPVLATGGLLTMFGLQTLVHMGSAMNVLPAKGMTLPLVSYGGSSVVSMGFAMGAVLALTRRRGRGTVSRAGLSRMASV